MARVESYKRIRRWREPPIQSFPCRTGHRPDLFVPNGTRSKKKRRSLDLGKSVWQFSPSSPVTGQTTRFVRPQQNSRQEKRGTLVPSKSDCCWTEQPDSQCRTLFLRKLFPKSSEFAILEVIFLIRNGRKLPFFTRRLYLTGAGI